jgi:hypothetical protein
MPRLSSLPAEPPPKAGERQTPPQQRPKANAANASDYGHTSLVRTWGGA